LPVGALYLVGDAGVGHHAGRAEVPGVIALGEAAQTFRVLLQAFYSIRSERQLMEWLEFDLLFRWLVGIGVDDATGIT
jgi:hypothetical protein